MNCIVILLFFILNGSYHNAYAQTCLSGTSSISPSNKSMSIVSLDGPVTQNEIDLFIGFLEQPNRIPTTALDNEIADKQPGQDVEALGLVYEVTQNPQILDRMITYSDTFLSLRNDPVNGRIMWTGKRELVWCTKPDNGTLSGYAGSEGLDTAGHIAYTAYHILKTPCLWDVNVTDNDPHKYGATYKERALTYVTEMDKTIDTYYLKYFIRENDSKIYNPNSSAWNKLGEMSANAPMPWNRQQMMTNGFLRMAECHEIIGDDASRVNKYFNIIQVSIDWMVKNFIQVKTKNGLDAYNWTYSTVSNSSEAIGIHSLYDIWGMYRAWQRKDKLNVSIDVMIKLANTMMYIINIDNKTFATRVDGTYDNTSTASLYGPWAFYAEFIPDWYKFVVNVNVNRTKTGPQYMGALLWVKNSRMVNSTYTPVNSTYTPISPHTSTSSHIQALPGYEICKLSFLVLGIILSYLY
ncbi:8867_t:CDS:1 [Cetraspora pellucida]|uniref:8867_t:CDS:1 n=1 Tax=Cetraspora pellucida TaxID=1433469 RepID=A0A9N9NGC9_9GLOM|nr:8867_t:CDS:1 [Cetraspora pellucida]